MRLRSSPYVRRGQLVVAADYEHPECPMTDFRLGVDGRLESEPAEVPDGRIVYCHPDDEEWLRDRIAVAEEMGWAG